MAPLLPGLPVLQSHPPNNTALPQLRPCKAGHAERRAAATALHACNPCKHWMQAQRCEKAGAPCEAAGS
jgi:hypothetical protein